MNRPDNRIKIQLNGVRYNLGTHYINPACHPPEDISANSIVRDFLSLAAPLDEPQRHRLAELFRAEGKFSRRAFRVSEPSEPEQPSTRQYLLWHAELDQYRMSNPKFYTANIDDAAHFTESEACDACLANPKLSMRPAP
jgi:hypothetical protein